MIDHDELVGQLAKERLLRKKLEDLLQHQKRQLEEKEETIAKLYSIISQIEDQPRSSNHHQDHSSDALTSNSLSTLRSLENLDICNDTLENTLAASSPNLLGDTTADNPMSSNEYKEIVNESPSSTSRRYRFSSVPIMGDQDLLKEAIARRKRPKRSQTPPGFWDSAFPGF